MHIVEAHGARIPLIGLGTYNLRGQACARLVQQALRLGYRHIDTAQMYGNEAEIGEGFRHAGVRRADVFITTKAWPDRFHARELQRAINESLVKLRMSYVDLFLLHWPNPAVPLEETLCALAKIKQAGLAHHIGVSNFTVPLVEQAVALCSEPLVANQIEIHPFIDQADVIAACRKHGMALTAYCPIARGKAGGNDVLRRIGEAHGKSAAQVSLRWLVQQGIAAIPRTSKIERLSENFEIFDFALTDAEMAEIGGLARPGGRVVNFSFSGN